MGSTVLTSALLVLLLASPPLDPGPPLLAEGPAVPLELSEPIVSSVEVRSDVPLGDREALLELITIEPGEPLSDRAVERTLTNFHAAGVSSEVDLLVRPDGSGGLIATVAVWGPVTVEAVRVEGRLGLAARDLERVLPQRAAQPLVDDRILRGLYALKDLYREKGYLEATVGLEVELEGPQKKRAFVTYRVDSGEQARIAALDLQGELAPFTADELRAVFRNREGDAYRASAVRADADRLRSWLVDRGHALADVTGLETPSDGAMRLAYAIEVGPRVETVVEGADLSRKKQRRLLPFLGAEGFDEALLPVAAGRVKRHFQERGFYDTEVETRAVRDGEVLEITVGIDRGERLTLEEVRFEGNEEVSSATLAGLMETAPKSLLELGDGRLVDAVLAADLANIRAYYALAGFDRAKVAEPRITLEGDRASVLIEIEEGRRRRVANLTIAGAEALDPEELERDLGRAGLLEEGGPYHRVFLEDSLATLRQRYEDLGYESVNVSGAVEWDASETLAIVSLEVLEGRRTLIDRVIVRGAQVTKPEIIERVVSLERGQPASSVSLLEAQRRLYRLGIFSDVEVELVPGGGETRDVMVRVTEGKNRRLSYGGGFDTEEGARGLLGYSQANLFGRAISFRGDLRLGQRDQRFRLGLEQPAVGVWAQPVTYTLFWSDEEERSFDVTRRGGRAEAVRQIGESHRLSLVYDYRRVLPVQRVLDPTDPSAPALDRGDRAIRISSLIPSWLVDRRDDPVNPQSGWSTFVQVQYAFPFLSTNEEFVKLFVQGTGHLPLGRLGQLVGSLRLGGIEPLESAGLDPLVPADLASSRISIAERFFAGGAVSHRAFEVDELGIDGQSLIGGEPVGGNGLFLANLDWRFPIAGGFGAVAFVDAGNVWPDWQAISGDDVKLGAGVGLRFSTAIGPVRAEIGWKIDREPFESPYAFFLSIGNPF